MIIFTDFKTYFNSEKNSGVTGRMLVVCYMKINEYLALMRRKMLYGLIKTSNGYIKC